MWYDTISEPLDVLEPAVRLILNVLDDPAATLHTRDVSDSHVLTSHPVPPVRKLPLTPAAPKLAQVTVRFMLPVPAAFPAPADFTTGPSADKASVMLPPCWPAVTDTRLLPLTPDPAITTTAVSDTQELLSHPDTPILPDAL